LVLWLDGWLVVGLLDGWLVVGLLDVWVVGWMVGWMGGCLVGRLVDCSCVEKVDPLLQKIGRLILTASNYSLTSIH
jgi:hypothetical protein